MKLGLSSNSSLSSKTSIKISIAAAFGFFVAIFNRRVLDLAHFGFGNCVKNRVKNRVENRIVWPSMLDFARF